MFTISFVLSYVTFLSFTWDIKNGSGLGQEHQTALHRLALGLSWIFCALDSNVPVHTGQNAISSSSSRPL